MEHHADARTLWRRTPASSAFGAPRAPPGTLLRSGDRAKLYQVFRVPSASSSDRRPNVRPATSRRHCSSSSSIEGIGTSLLRTSDPMADDIVVRRRGCLQSFEEVALSFPMKKICPFPGPDKSEPWIVHQIARGAIRAATIGRSGHEPALLQRQTVRLTQRMMNHGPRRDLGSASISSAEKIHQPRDRRRFDAIRASRHRAPSR